MRNENLIKIELKFSKIIKKAYIHSELDFIINKKQLNFIFIIILGLSVAILSWVAFFSPKKLQIAFAISELCLLLVAASLVFLTRKLEQKQIKIEEEYRQIEI